MGLPMCHRSPFVDGLIMGIAPEITSNTVMDMIIDYIEYIHGVALNLM